jgi:Uma2 family endonuclease
MEKWIFNGVKLAWLINPNEKMTSVYTSDGLINTVSFSDTLSGLEILPNFTVVLNDIFGE